jgi:hypothetical protein
VHGEEDQFARWGGWHHKEDLLVYVQCGLPDSKFESAQGKDSGFILVYHFIGVTLHFIEIKSESTIQITGARPVMGRRLTCLEKFSITFCEF